MARKPQVRFFSSRNAFYCQWQGHQHRLGDGPDDSPTGPNYLKALENFKNLMALSHAETAGDCQTVGTFLELYLRHISTRRAQATLRLRKIDFQLLCEFEGTGHRPVNQVTTRLVERYADHMKAPAGQNVNSAWRPS